jgi:sugar phosphate isomerase/epimerase
MAKVPVALQMYTVRDVMAKDFRGTVRKVAQMGYAGIELAGSGGLSAAELKDLLAETKLALAGSHIGLSSYEKELDQVIAFNKAIGMQYVGVPALPNEMRTAAGFRKVAAFMNKIGAELKREGLTLYYHNHAFEFEVIDGMRGMDVLFKETDPALVKFECDVYWVHYAGLDPAAFIRANSGRYPLIHLKDMTGVGAERTFAEVGEGVIDFAPIFAASEAQGAQWYIVEQDRCARPSLESAQISLQNLKKWGKA